MNWTRSKRRKTKSWPRQKLTGRAALKALAKAQQDAIDLLAESARPAEKRNQKRARDPPG